MYTRVRAGRLQKLNWFCATCIGCDGGDEDRENWCREYVPQNAGVVGTDVCNECSNPICRAMEIVGWKCHGFVPKGTLLAIYEVGMGNETQV